MSLPIWAPVLGRGRVSVGARISHLKYTWLRLGVGTVAFVVLAGGLAASIQTSGVEQTLANIDLNIVATVVVATGAIFTFQLAIRFHILRRLLANQPATPQVIRQPAGRRPNQARAVVAQLQDDRHPGRISLEARTRDARLSFVRELIPALTARGIVAVVLHLAPDDDNIVARTEQEFQSLVRSAGVSDVPLTRTLEWLATHRRMVVIFDNVDTADSIGGEDWENTLVRQRITGLTAACYPFVAIMDTSHAQVSDIDDRVAIAPIDNVFEITPSPAAGNSNDKIAQVQNDHAVRSLAISLQRTGLQRATVVSDTADPSAVEAISVVLSRHGAVHYSWMLLARSTGTTTDQLGDGTPESRVVGGLVVRLLALGGDQIDVMDLHRDLPNDDPHSVLLAVRHLEGQGILTRSDISGKTLLGFADPAIAEVAAGAWLAKKSNQYSVSIQRSAMCLATEVYLRVVGAARDQLVAWSDAVAMFKQSTNCLAAASAAYSAITASSVFRDQLGSEWLVDLWERSGPAERMTFVKQISGNAVSSYSSFLWTRVIDREFAINPHPLRRSICRVLGASGADVWAALNPKWHELINDRSLEGVLAWHRRPIVGPWRGSTVASLCWVLPAIVATHPNPFTTALLRQLVVLVAPQGRSISDKPDVGIEISLAEGCKDACYTCFSEGLPLPFEVLQVIRTLIRRGVSWASRLVALQALFIAAAIDRELVDEVSAECRLNSGNDDEHPILRAYSSVLLVPREAMRRGECNVGEYVWNDDTEALSAAGGELGDDAVLILAIVAIVLNFCEARATVGDSSLESHGPRVKALTENVLPECFRIRRIAAASPKLPCTCGFQICGPHLDQLVMRRPLSRTFIYRCLAARPTGIMHSAIFAATLRSLREHLRRLTI